MNEKEWDNKVRKFLEIGKKDSVLIGKDKTGKVVSVIKFARAEWEDWEEFKKMDIQELIEHYISLTLAMKYSVSVRDCELQCLMEMALEMKGVDWEKVEDKLKKYGD